MEISENVHLAHWIQRLNRVVVLSLDWPVLYCCKYLYTEEGFTSSIKYTASAMPAVNEKRGYSGHFSFFKVWRASGLSDFLLLFISLSFSLHGTSSESGHSDRTYSFWVGTSRPSAVNHSIITMLIYFVCDFLKHRYIKADDREKIPAAGFTDIVCFQLIITWPHFHLSDGHSERVLMQHARGKGALIQGET